MNIWIVKQRIKRALEKSSALFIFLLKLKNRNSSFINRIVAKDTDIVIEGYPRSSNSFAAKAFKISQPTALKIATHTHSHTQVLQGIALGVPTLVLIRKPKDCILSLKALNLQVNGTDEAVFKKYSVTSYLEWYIAFYSALLPVKNKLVWATFEDVTTDFDAVIKRVNTFYAKDFALFGHTKEKEKELFDNSGFHLSPSADREVYKQRIQNEYDSEENKNLVIQANRVYQAFLK